MNGNPSSSSYGGSGGNSQSPLFQYLNGSGNTDKPTSVTTAASNLLSLSKESPILLIIHSAITPIQSSPSTVTLSPSLLKNVTLDSPNLQNKYSAANNITLPSLSLSSSGSSTNNTPNISSPVMYNSSNPSNFSISQLNQGLNVNANNNGSNSYLDSNINNIKKKNLLCKTPDCIVCLKGPPASFEKGNTPIWAQILLVVLYALTESSKSVSSKTLTNEFAGKNIQIHNNNTNNRDYPNGKKYFHLRDDIYEFINIHWDVICRRERIPNWKHTIGMTLSHYHTLFKNGYNIFQNTGYWCLKDDAPNPYLCEVFMDTSRKRKYISSKSQREGRDKDNSNNNNNNNNSNTNSPVINSNNNNNSNINSQSSNTSSPLQSSKLSLSNPNFREIFLGRDPNFNNKNNEEEEILHPSKKINLSSTPPSPINLLKSPDLNNSSSGDLQYDTFNVMKKEIELCKKEVIDLQTEVNFLKSKKQQQQQQQQQSQQVDDPSSPSAQSNLSPSTSFNDIQGAPSSPPKPSIPFKYQTFINARTSSFDSLPVPFKLSSSSVPPLNAHHSSSSSTLPPLSISGTQRNNESNKISGLLD